MSDNVPPATTPEDGELSLAEIVFLRIAEQRERDWSQDRRIAQLEADLAAARAQMDERTARFQDYIRDQAEAMRYLTSAADSCTAKRM